MLVNAASQTWGQLILKYIPDDLKRVIVGTVAVYNSKLEELAK